MRRRHGGGWTPLGLGVALGFLVGQVFDTGVKNASAYHLLYLKVVYPRAYAIAGRPVDVLLFSELPGMLTSFSRR